MFEEVISASVSAFDEGKGIQYTCNFEKSREVPL